MKSKTLVIAASIAALMMSSCGSKSSSADGVERDSTFTTVQHPEWSRNAVIYEVNLRQYTDSGTVNAFAEHLPRLKKLGVDILWMMPIHPISKKDRKGTLGSYYAAQDYTAFNPEFGTIEDFKTTVKKAHDLGMKVILDWVPNHTGRDHRWVTEHPDWYKKDSLGNMVGLYDWTDVYVLDYSNPATRRGMIDAMKFWLTDVDVDGFRCDVAMEVPVDFWDEARKELQATKPDMFMLAEASEPKLQKNAFDMGYNWPMKDLFSEIAATAGQYTYKGKDGKVRTFPVKHAVAIDSLLKDQAEKYPRDTYMMNMITNHDLNSWEGTEFDRLGELNRTFAVLSYTLPGMPMMYTGQEVGFNRPFEFFEKDKAPDWNDDHGFFDFYRKLNDLKHNEEALRAGVEGGDMVRYPTSNDDIYVFSREKGKSRVMVFANLSMKNVPVEFSTSDIPVVDNMINLFTGKDAELPGTLAPGSFAIFIGK